jgi:hypothetical protein
LFLTRSNHRICYERELKLPCKIIKIDETCGAVLVESLRAQDGGINLWISPDDLVGNHEVSKIPNMTKSVNGNPDDVQSSQSRNTRTTEQIGHTNPHYVSPVEETIDLTEEDENESYPDSLQSRTACQKSNDFNFSSKPEFRLQRRGQSFTAKSSFAQRRPDIPTSRYTSTGPSCQVPDIRSTFLPNIETQMTFSNERSMSSSVADVCRSLSSVSGIPNNEYNRGRHFGNQNLCYNNFTNSIQNQQSLLERTQQNFGARGNLDTTSSIGASATLDAYMGAQMLSDRFATMGSSRSALLHSGATIQSELDLLKQHGMALEILVSTTDVGTIVATLQFIKRMHQRGIPVGPTAAKLVSDAERTSRVLMEDKFLRHMTAPIFSGGNGYNLQHAGMILCRLAPFLGTNLGRLDSPMVDSTKLLSLGLNRVEVLDILPFIQSFEDNILMKTLSFRRQLANLY